MLFPAFLMQPVPNLGMDFGIILGCWQLAHQRRRLGRRAFTITGRGVTGTVATPAAGGTQQLLTDLAKLFVGDRFPPCEPDVAADQRPWIEESNPAPPPVAIVTDEIGAIAQMQPDRRAVLWRVGHWSPDQVVLDHMKKHSQDQQPIPRSDRSHRLSCLLLAEIDKVLRFNRISGVPENLKKPRRRRHPLASCILSQRIPYPHRY